MKFTKFGLTPISVKDHVEMSIISPDAGEERKFSSPECGRSQYGKYSTIPQQTHSLNVGLVERPFQIFEDTDALVSFDRNIPIGVLTADCVPLVMYSPDIEGKAAVHAGWKGTLGGIVDNTLDVLEDHGADLSSLVAAIGPAIHVESYEVDRDFADRFIKEGFGDFVVWPDGEDGKPHVDLVGINRERLLRRGVMPNNIHIHPADTFGFVDEEGFRFPSHRRDGTLLRLLTFIR